MKYILFFLTFISYNVLATENRVLSGKTKHIEEKYHEGKIIHNGSVVEELTLQNCNAEIYSFNSSSTSKIKISISDREFIADGVSFKLNSEGKCVVKLTNGHGSK